LYDQLKDFEGDEPAYNMITDYEENKNLYIYNETSVNLSYETKRKYRENASTEERLNVEKKKIAELDKAEEVLNEYQKDIEDILNEIVERKRYYGTETLL